MSRQAPLFVLAALVFLSACGPIRSTAGLVKADRAIAEARSAGASAAESYPMVLAEALRQKAFEEQGYGEYDSAERLALEAEQAAQEALQLVTTMAVPESTTSRQRDVPVVDPSASSDGQQDDSSESSK